VAEIREDVLLGRINREIKENSLIMTISELSRELQEDIKDTVDPVIVHQGLKATHGFLLELIPSQCRKYFKWPKK